MLSKKCARREPVIDKEVINMGIGINFRTKKENCDLKIFFTTAEEEDSSVETSEVDLDQYEEIN
jgi:biotin-(acetyl-CoA carboxylase) ligase